MKILFLYIITLIISISPREFKCLVARVVSFLWTILDINRRLVVSSNLRHSGIDNPCLPDVWEVFNNYLLDFFNLLYVRSLTRSELLNLFITEDLKIFKETLEKKKGVILISPHLGGYEIGAIFLSATGLPMVTVAEWKGVGELHYTFYKHLRGRFGMRVLPLERRITPLSIRNYLKENKVIALVTDRKLTGTGSTVEFLDGRTSFPKGPFYFAMRFVTPIIVVSFIRKRGRYICKLYDPIYTDSIDEKSVTQKVIEIFESEIRNNPYMWYVFQPIWMVEK